MSTESEAGILTLHDGPCQGDVADAIRPGFMTRRRLCEQYLRRRDEVRPDEAQNFNRVICLVLSVTVILAVTYSNGWVGLLHSVAALGALWWLFVFAGSEAALGWRPLRKLLAVLMSTVRFTRRDMQRLCDGLEAQANLFKHRMPVIVLTICGIGIFGLSRGKSETKTILLLIGAALAYAGLAILAIRPLLVTGDGGEESEASNRRMVSLLATQDLGGLIVVVLSLVLLKALAIGLIWGLPAGAEEHLDRAYLYFLGAGIVYFIVQSVPALVSLVYPAWRLEGPTSALFYVAVAVGLTVLGLAGVRGIRLFMLGLALAVGWDLWATYRAGPSRLTVGKVGKLVVVAAVGAAAATLLSEGYEATVDMLGVTTTHVITFTIYLTGAIWIDNTVRGVIEG